MPHDAAFHQSTLFVKVKKDLQTKECNIFSLNIFYFNLVITHTYIQVTAIFLIYLTPLDKYNVLSQVYCIKREGRIH